MPHRRLPIRGGAADRCDASDALWDALSDIARVDAALAVADQVELFGAALAEDPFDRCQQLRPTDRGGIDRVDLRYEDAVSIGLQCLAYAVEIIDAGQLLKAEKSMNQHEWVGTMRKIGAALRIARDRQIGARIDEARVVNRMGVGGGAACRQRDEDHPQRGQRARGHAGCSGLGRSSTGPQSSVRSQWMFGGSGSWSGAPSIVSPKASLTNSWTKLQPASV